MLADLLPMMTETVRQYHTDKRDLFGKPLEGTITEHRARVTYSPGTVRAPVSRDVMPDATAAVWLIDHPYPIVIGDTFELPDAAALKVARLERRKLPGGVLHKVYLT